MDFASNNNLSMTGGDQFTDINADLARCVFVDTYQIISGVKEFASLPTTSLAPTTGIQLTNKTYVDTKATDTLVVHLSGPETITGEKIFTAQQTFNSPVQMTGSTLTMTAGQNVEFNVANGVFDINSTDPLATGLYGQVRIKADTKFEMACLNTDFIIFPTSIDTISDGATTMTASTEITLNAHNVPINLSSNGTFSVSDATTSQTLISANDTAMVLQAPNFGSTLDIAGSLIRIDGVPSGLNQLFFGNTHPLDINILNGNLGLMNVDIFCQSNASDTGSRSIGISVPSTTIGDTFLSLYQRTSASFLNGSGFEWRRVLGGVFKWRRKVTSSGGISTFTDIQSLDPSTSIDTFTYPTQTKVATTAFKVQNVAGTDKLNIGASTSTLTNTNIVNVATSNFVVQNPSGTNKLYIDSTYSELSNDSIMAEATTGNISFVMGSTGALVVQNNTIEKFNIGTALTTLTNTTLTNVATTAFKVQNVAGTDKLNIAPTLTTLTNPTITNLATTAFKVQNVAGTDKLNIAPSLTTLTNTAIRLNVCPQIGSNFHFMASIQLPCVQTDFNYGTANTALGFIWIPDNVPANNQPRFSCPFNFYVYGWSISADSDGFAGTMTIIVNKYAGDGTGAVVTTTSATTSAWTGTERCKSGVFATPLQIDNTFSIGATHRYSTASLNSELGIVLWGYQY